MAFDALEGAAGAGDRNGGGREAHCVRCDCFCGLGMMGLSVAFQFERIWWVYA